MQCWSVGVMGFHDSNPPFLLYSTTPAQEYLNEGVGATSACLHEAFRRRQVTLMKELKSPLPVYLLSHGAMQCWRVGAVGFHDSNPPLLQYSTAPILQLKNICLKGG